MDWKYMGYEQYGICPPLPTYQTVLGKDKHGRKWICNASALASGYWMLCFKSRIADFKIKERYDRITDRIAEVKAFEGIC